VPPSYRPAFAIAASGPKTECANCRHYEAIIADFQAWVEDLRESREEASKASKKKDKPVQRPQTVALPKKPPIA
jgi:hypothetical protein